MHTDNVVGFPTPENEAQIIAETPSTDYTARWILEQAVQTFLETHTTADLDDVLSEYRG